MEPNNDLSGTVEKRLLAFVVSEEHNVISLHVGKEGIEILLRSLGRIKKDLDSGEQGHDHLMSEEWGGWELSISD